MVYVLDRKLNALRHSFIRFMFSSILAAGIPVHGWAQQQAENATIGTTGEEDIFGQTDVFQGLESLSAEQMSLYSGGSETTFGDVGLNLATNTSSLNGNSVEGNVETGRIQDINLNDVGGINTLMFNTGNNVNFQSNMLINIFVK